MKQGIYLTPLLVSCQDDLNTCHKKANGGHQVGENSGANITGIEFRDKSSSQIRSNASSVSPLNRRHIVNYLSNMKVSDQIDEIGNHLNPDPAQISPVKTGHSHNANIIQQPPIQPSGDPNEDPVGNVFI